MNKEEIAILTTVANFNLYKKTAPLFPSEIQKYVIDGSNGMHGIHSILYMMKKFKNKGVKWLMMADEDVVFKKPEAMFELINYMEANNYTVAGVRDGGVISHRSKNPYAINTFLSILNLDEVLQLWDKEEVSKHQYIEDNEFGEIEDELPFSYDKSSLFEPYYQFYFWLLRQKKKILFLKSEMYSENDLFANTVYDMNDEILAYHTWHARSYGVNEKHTKRINKILGEVMNPEDKMEEVYPIIWKDKTFYIKSKINKFARRVKNKWFS